MQKPKSEKNVVRKLTHEEIVNRQHTRNKTPQIPVSVILNNIRSLHNVGAIFRTCDAVGIEKLWLCGITGAPPQPQISKTALGAEDTVEWEHRKNALEVIKELKAKNYQIVLLEQIDKAIDYAEFHPQFPVCLVVGNEVDGISEELVSLCDQAIEIEMVGLKNSLNVSVAFGIMAYHFRTCFIVK